MSVTSVAPTVPCVKPFLLSNAVRSDAMRWLEAFAASHPKRTCRVCGQASRFLVRGVCVICEAAVAGDDAAPHEEVSTAGEGR